MKNNPMPKMNFPAQNGDPKQVYINYILKDSIEQLISGLTSL